MNLSRARMYEILDVGRKGDAASRACDRILVLLITANVLAAILESIPELALAHADAFAAFEVFSVLVFSAEYVLRAVCCVENPDPRFRRPVVGRVRYLFSPIALADLAAILPFYLGAILAIDLRVLRVLRLVRIFKLAHYFGALEILLDVIRRDRHAFGAAYFVVVLGMLIAASGVYLYEHEAQPAEFGSIPAALWWAVTTLTTVGYGDVTPVTLGGKIFGAFVMMLGVGIVAIPTGILATGFALELRRRHDVYTGELAQALEDGRIDASEREHLEEVRQVLSLTREATASLEDSTRRLGHTLSEPLTFCPHCGEHLLDPPKEQGGPL